MSRPLLVLALLATAGLLACPKTSPSGGSHDESQVSNPNPNPNPDPAVRSTCLRDADCDGGVCEGQGCGDAEPGTCAPIERLCTRDSQVYCGCDGETFRASGSCPGQRYERRGACEPTPTPGDAADGSSCLASSECRSGVCEGQGCGPDQPGECMPEARPCTRDLQPYCGCDGQTFRSSGSCPGQRYEHRGECSPGATP